MVRGEYVRRGLRVAFLSVPILGLAACKGGEAAAPPRDALTLEAVFKPFLRADGKGDVVVCDNLEATLSREIYVDQIRKVFSDSRHRFVRQVSEPPVETFTNVDGGIDLPLRFYIGAQQFLVLRRARFTVLSRGEARCDLRAFGHVEVVPAGATAPREVAEVVVQDGVWTER